MERVIKIALVSGVVALGVITLFLFVKFGGVFERENGVPGPRADAIGHTWDTTLIISDDPERSKHAVHAIFEAPEGFDPQNPSLTPEVLVEFCNLVVANHTDFDQGGLTLSALKHVQLNLRIGDAKAYAFDPVILLKDGQCGNNFYFPQSDRDLMQTASNHSAQDEVNAVFRAWGTEMGNTTYSVGTNGRQILVDFQTHPEFKRALNNIDPHALCIVALMHTAREVNMFVTKIDPSTYEQMVITVQAITNKLGSVVTTSQSGTAVFDLNKGNCGARVQT